MGTLMLVHDVMYCVGMIALYLGITVLVVMFAILAYRAVTAD